MRAVLCRQVGCRRRAGVLRVWPMADVRLLMHVGREHAVQVVILVVAWREPEKGEPARSFLCMFCFSLAQQRLGFPFRLGP